MYKHIITGKTCRILETKTINGVQYVIYEKTHPEYAWEKIDGIYMKDKEVKMTKFIKDKTHFDLFYRQVEASL